ncbi:hypothetical protein C2G38_2184447 [Gigaspora rosea]|uniref:Uncharacterized protein n=1 Tax=Gigaspora rosea TaxID=44941 RepID=A0A397VGM9_9GLOM|nr:hypothetical protein C2G38_2184447 [Gigaspora rosea]
MSSEPDSPLPSQSSSDNSDTALPAKKTIHNENKDVLLIELIHEYVPNYFFDSYTWTRRQMIELIAQTINLTTDLWTAKKVLIDCKTRWNSSYLAWKRVLNLDDAIRNSQICKGDNFNKLRLNSEEFNVVNILALFEKITQKVSSAKYSTINLINPYMYLIKRKFVSTDSSAEDSKSSSVKYEELSYNLHVSLLISKISINLINQNEENNTFANMWASGQEIIQAKKDKVSQYINLPKALENDNSLTW